MASNYTFRDIAGLTTFLKVLLGLYAAMAVVSIVSSCMQIELLNRWANVTQEEVDSNDLRERIIALSNLVFLLFTYVIFGKWIVRANRNVRALGATDLRMTPGWAVGFFFIPIANLWKPYQAMQELWEASHYLNPSTTINATSIMPIWWALWLISSFVDNLYFRLIIKAEGVEQFRTATTVGILNDILDIPLCIAAIILVSRIGNAQTVFRGMVNNEELDKNGLYGDFTSPK